MKNNIRILIACFLSITAFGQVAINVPEDKIEASADLHIYSINKGLAVPQVGLISFDKYAPIIGEPKDGLVVYNSNKTAELNKGIYFWKNKQWNPMGGTREKTTIIQKVDEEYLGYSVSKVVTPPSSINSINAEMTTCRKWEIKDGGNGHTYCGYKSKLEFNFTLAFEAAKNSGGYVVTITSNDEFNFINDNIINGNQKLTDAIWLGYVKLATPGNKPKYNWITAEKSVYNWGVKSDVQSHFATNEPQQSTTDDLARCTFIPKNNNSGRKWHSSGCNVKTDKKNLIIEFDK